MREKLLERLLYYTSIDTQSDPNSETYPSTARQLRLLNHLLEEMISLGLRDVEIDPYGYVTATIPATAGCEALPVIGFLSHVDTSPDMSGAGVRAQVVERYEGGDLELGNGVTMRADDFPELERCIGHTLITTDGTTLLGADDKAGIAEIITAAEYLIDHPELPHGAIRIGFTPDEEVGRGVDHFDVERFGAQWAYTMDGSMAPEIEFENFNAASARVTIHGRNIHPGYAKGRMINALEVAIGLHIMLPKWETPESTDGYEGFFHLHSMQGDVEQATLEYIIRDHSAERFEQKKQTLALNVERRNAKYPAPIIELEMHDQYHNMAQIIDQHPEVKQRALQAIERLGLTPEVKPIRGGTDGARLSYMGLPCPNIFTGGANFHGRYEFASLDMMVQATQVIIGIATGK